MPSAADRNEAFDSFISPIMTRPTTPRSVTFQGIRCGSLKFSFVLRFYRSAGDLPNRSDYVEIRRDEQNSITSIDGIAPRACPSGRDGTLVTYGIAFIERSFTAGEQTWISIFAYYDYMPWDSLDQWQFRHGKPADGYAAAYRPSTGTFVRQTRDLAFKLE